MDETKKILRSLLVSSPLVTSVEKLNQDYRDFMGHNIPFRELGFDSLLSFLHNISDVLKVDGSSMKSSVMLIVSEKTAHVNDMVLKQKRNKPPATRYGRPNRRPRINNRHNFRSYQPDKNIPQNSCQRNNKSLVDYKAQDLLNKNINHESPNISHDNKIHVEKHLLSPNLIQYETTDIKLQTNTSTNKDLHYLRRPNYNINNSHLDVTKGLKDLTLDIGDDDFMRQLLFKKDLYNKKSTRNTLQNSGKLPSTDTPEFETRVPKTIQENLKCLISKFPHGIWCSELPSEYFKEFNRDLHYEELGYRSLIIMCMELYNIFICSKESSCDFKLYDVRKPLLKPGVLQDFGSSLDGNSPEDTPQDSLPKLDWKSCSCLIPEDILPLGGEIKREFVSETTNVGDILEVVVAEIYDISKFWLYKNNGRLDKLMDNMQEFYKEHSETYLIPEDLLEAGLYCVVVTLNEFHRSVIINVQDDIVKVFFIDYGSLGIAPKNQVWFIRNSFCELPAQAIRARLADIYPPVENMSWSKEATRAFKGMASMKGLEAKIRNILPSKQVIEVYLENLHLCPGRFINNILCSEGFALMTSEKRKQCIEDPHCVPKVKFVHLFPTFEEIEYWLVPSVENMITLSEMDISPDLFLPQYFSRHVDKNLLDKIEKKTRKSCARKEKLIKSIDLNKFENFHSMAEMDQAFYGNSYSHFENDLNTEFDEREEDTDEDVDMWIFLNSLRRKRLNKSDLDQDTEDRHGEESQNRKLIKDGNDDVAKQFFGSAFVDNNTFSKTQVENSSCLNQLNSQNISELERYLSDESSPINSPIPPKLRDLDDSSSSCSDGDYSNNKGPYSEYSKCDVESVISLSVSSSRSGIESMEPASILNNSITIEKQKYSSESSYSDLIKFDVVLDNPNYSKVENEYMLHKKLEVSSSDPFGTINEETSNFSNNLTKKHDSVTNLKTSAQPSFDLPQQPPMPPKRWTNPVPVLRPPPGFGPLPNYGPPFEVGSPGRVRTYQPWSTNTMDNAGFNQQQNPKPYPMYYSQVPVVVNYNIMYNVTPGYFGNQFGDQKKNGQ